MSRRLAAGLAIALSLLLDSPSFGQSEPAALEKFVRANVVLMPYNPVLAEPVAVAATVDPKYHDHLAYALAALEAAGWISVGKSPNLYLVSYRNVSDISSALVAAGVSQPEAAAQQAIAINLKEPCAMNAETHADVPFVAETLHADVPFVAETAYIIASEDGPMSPVECFVARALAIAGMSASYEVVNNVAWSTDTNAINLELAQTIRQCMIEAEETSQSCVLAHYKLEPVD